MECKFLQHGVAVYYNQIVRPCCLYRPGPGYVDKFHISQIPIANFHSTKEIESARNAFANNQWPDSCIRCKNTEQQGRKDSMRLNGANAYADYHEDDITLEIRPGNTCNFACQTCWPEASSRVLQYYQKIEHTGTGSLLSTVNEKLHFENFDFLNPVANRIKNVVLLGGEPFFDKNCLKFLDYAADNLTSEITIFTNGSVIKHDFIEKYKGRLILVFSLDATGKSAEYVRNGTVWQDVVDNYNRCKQYSNVDVRCNVTTSTYNYHLLEDLIDFLLEDWPSLVMFGTAFQEEMTEAVVPPQLRPELIASLSSTIIKLKNSSIGSDQKQTAINAVASIRNNLKSNTFRSDLYTKWQGLTRQLDSLKEQEPDDFISRMLSIEVD